MGIKRTKGRLIPRALKFGKYRVGPFCGASVFSLSDWKYYGLMANQSGPGQIGFSIGPILFSKDTFVSWEVTYPNLTTDG